VTSACRRSSSTGRRPVSATDLELSRRLKAAGYQIEPRQLERWRVEGGVVEQSSQPGAFAQACQVKEFLDQRLTLEQIAIVQFMRRRPVTTEALKKALRNGLAETLGAAASVRGWMEAKKLAQTEAETLTTQLARQPPTREVRKQIHSTAGRRGERVNQAFTRVMTVALMFVQAGEAPTRRELGELLDALGLPENTTDLAAIAALAKRLGRNNLEVALDSASRSDLEQAREDHLVVASSLNAPGYPPFGASKAEYTVTTSLLILLAVRKDFGNSDMNHVIQLLQSDSTLD